MNQASSTVRGLTRRASFCRRATAAGAAFVVGAGFVARQTPPGRWRRAVLKPETMATLIQMARDIYPHDHVADEFYAIAVKGYDTARPRPSIEAGIAALERRGAGQGLCQLPRQPDGSATASTSCAAWRTAPSSRRSAAGS